jgi:hypothetical protein
VLLSSGIYRFPRQIYEADSESSTRFPYLGPIRVDTSSAPEWTAPFSGRCQSSVPYKQGFCILLLDQQLPTSISDSALCQRLADNKKKAPGDLLSTPSKWSKAQFQMVSTNAQSLSEIRPLIPAEWYRFPVSAKAVWVTFDGGWG